MLTENHPQTYKKKKKTHHIQLCRGRSYFPGCHWVIPICSAGPKWPCQGTSKRVINGPGLQDFRSVEWRGHYQRSWWGDSQVEVSSLQCQSPVTKCQGRSCIIFSKTKCQHTFPDSSVSSQTHPVKSCCDPKKAWLLLGHDYFPRVRRAVSFRWWEI